MSAHVPDPMVDELAEALDRAARLGAQAERMEEERKILFSEIYSDTEGTDKAREHRARADLRFQQATADLSKVKEDAAIWRAKAIAIQQRIDVWRTRMASERIRR